MWKLHRKLKFPNIFLLAAIYTWAPAFKYIVMMTKEGSTKIVNLMGRGSHAGMWSYNKHAKFLFLSTLYKISISSQGEEYICFNPIGFLSTNNIHYWLMVGENMIDDEWFREGRGNPCYTPPPPNKNKYSQSVVCVVFSKTYQNE